MFSKTKTKTFEQKLQLESISFVLRSDDTAEHVASLGSFGRSLFENNLLSENRDVYEKAAQLFVKTLKIQVFDNDLFYLLIY